MGWLDPIFGRKAPPGAVEGDPARVAQVQRVLARLRPAVEADGGAVELVSVRGGSVTVRFSGACKSCSAIDMTVQQALEPSLRAELEWLEELRVE